MTTTRTHEARPFRRSKYDRMLGGVSGAIAERFDVDIMTVRIAFVALAVLGGGGALLYAAAWLLIPEEAADASIAESFAKNLGWR